MLKEVTFGVGFFWCVEVCFQELNGVISIYPSYAAGNALNPMYKEVCNGSS